MTDLTAPDTSKTSNGHPNWCCHCYTDERSTVHRSAPEILELCDTQWELFKIRNDVHGKEAGPTELILDDGYEQHAFTLQDLPKVLHHLARQYLDLLTEQTQRQLPCELRREHQPSFADTQPDSLESPNWNFPRARTPD